MKENEYCGICGNGILFGYKTKCDDCKEKEKKEEETKNENTFST